MQLLLPSKPPKRDQSTIRCKKSPWQLNKSLMIKKPMLISSLLKLALMLQLLRLPLLRQLLRLLLRLLLMLPLLRQLLKKRKLWIKNLPTQQRLLLMRKLKLNYLLQRQQPLHKPILMHIISPSQDRSAQMMNLPQVVIRLLSSLVPFVAQLASFSSLQPLP